MEMRHRCISITSGPGLIVQALRKDWRVDPVVLLDDVDEPGQIHR